MSTQPNRSRISSRLHCFAWLAACLVSFAHMPLAFADHLLQLERHQGVIRASGLIKLVENGDYAPAMPGKPRLQVARAGKPPLTVALEFSPQYPANHRELASVRVPDLSNGDVVYILDDAGVTRESIEIDLPMVLSAKLQFDALESALRTAPPDFSATQELDFAAAAQVKQRFLEFDAIEQARAGDPVGAETRASLWRLQHLGLGGQCGWMTVGANNEPLSDFRFRAASQPEVAVSGRFVAPSGSVVPWIGAFVYRVTGSSISYLTQTSANANGQFSIEANVGDNLRFLPYGVQAPLVQLAEINATVNASASVGDLVIPNGATLTARTIQANGQLITQGTPIDFVNLSTGWTTFSSTVNGTARLGSSLNPPHLWELRAWPPAPFVGATRRTGLIGSDQTVDLVLPVGIQIAGRAITSDGSSLPASAVSIQCVSASANGQQTQGRATAAADGTFNLYLEAGVDYTCTVSASAPYIAPTLPPRSFVAGDRLDFSVIRAADVNVQVTAPSGGALGFSAVMTADGMNGRFCSNSPCRLLAEPNVPSYLAIDLGTTSVFLPPAMIGPRVFNDETITLSASQRFTLSGTISPPRQGRIRIYAQNGQFISSNGFHSGNYSIPLRNGTYRAEIYLDEGEWGNSGEVYEPPIVSTVTINNANVTQNFSLTALPQVDLQITGPCLSLTPRLGLVLRQNSQMLADTSWIFPTASLGSPAPGQCRYRWTAKMPLGAYQAELRATGWDIPDQTINFTSPGQVVSITAKGSRVWNGRLITGTGQGALSSITLYDAAQRYVLGVSTDASGNFSLPLINRGLVELAAPEAGASVRRRIVLTPGLSPPATVQLEDISFVSGTQGSLERLFGNGDLNRYNIVFVAESYTGINESFTDSNSNGTWDGVVWFDLDGNGVYSNGDLATLHGSASWPTLGSNPTAQNEAFVDLNGDGFPNRNEAALFRRNGESYMRSFLGSDVWERHRDKFNAFLLFLPSPQAGMDIISASGQTLFARNTRFNASLELGRYILNLDRNAVLAAARAALPEMDQAVALINQPLAFGRANVSGNLQVYYGGWTTLSPNGSVQSHEMGHSIGWLADEYTEFNQVLSEWPISGTNTARTSNVSLLSWRSDLPAGSTAPSRFASNSGIFEGSSYSTGGAYRPSFHSTMHGNSPLFNAISERSIETRLAPFGPVLADEIFRSDFE